MKKNKTRTISVRVTDDQLEQWKRSAREMGVSLSQWLVFRANGVIVIQQKAA